MPEYTLLAVLSVVATVAVEVLWLRTGIFRRSQYWIAMAIVYFFHVLVDGWLTKLSAPIVIYDPGQITGVRVPWDIPVEDYLFGFSMITLTLMLWVRQGDREGRPEDPDRWDRTDRTDTTGITDESGRLGRPTTQEAP
jgi:lycopene cyclase domain-containing protein